MTMSNMGVAFVHLQHGVTLTLAPPCGFKIFRLSAKFSRTQQFPNWPQNVEFGDIVRGLPIEEGSCRAIYCSHVLEHLALDDFRVALHNTYRYLAPEGVFRFVVPDLKVLATDYVTSRVIVQGGASRAGAGRPAQ